MLDLVADNKDLLALLISVLAVVLAWWTAHTARRQARLERYMRLHDLLVTPQAAAGRRLLFLAHAAGHFPLPEEDAWDRINQSLALYDMAGMYARNNLIADDFFLEAWHHPLQNIRPAVEAFLEHAGAEGVPRSWISLTLLLDSAAAYRSTVGCCTP